MRAKDSSSVALPVIMILIPSRALLGPPAWFLWPQLGCRGGEENPSLKRQESKEGEKMVLGMYEACRLYPQTDWCPRAKRPVDKRPCHWTMSMCECVCMRARMCVCARVCVRGWNLKLRGQQQILNNNTSLLDLTQKTMSPYDIYDPFCLRVFVFMSLHLHLNAKSVCVWGLASGLRGRLAGRSHDEQTLQGRIISYYPQFPVMRCRWWVLLDLSHGQKWAESLTRFIRPSSAPCPLPPPRLPASHPALPATTCRFPYALNPFKIRLRWMGIWWL